MSKFKVGDRVRILKSPYGGYAETGTVGGDYAEYPGFVFVRTDDREKTNDNKHDVHGLGLSYNENHLERLLPLTKAQRAIAKAEADLQALKDRAAKKAKLAAERKAKAERAKLMKGMGPVARRVVELLKAKPDAFGCQKDNAIALAAAIIGADADKIRKALA